MFWDGMQRGMVVRHLPALPSRVKQPSWTAVYLRQNLSECVRFHICPFLTDTYY